MKKSNMNVILDWLSEGNTGTCPEISKATGIALRSVETLMTIGKKLDYVRSIGTAERDIGARGRLLSVWSRTGTEITEKMRAAPVYPKKGKKKKVVRLPIDIGTSMVEKAIKNRTLLEVHWGQYGQ